MKNNIPIIYYHSIAPQKNRNWFRNWLTLELKYFEVHLKYFKEKGYQSLFLDEYFQLRKTNTKGKYVVLTFDDGYLDNYIYVYPLLKKYGFKGTIFVSPDFVDKKAIVRKNLLDYWDNKASMHEIDEWGFLSWEEMRLMQSSGVIDIQSHTMTHTKYFVSDKIIGFHYPGYDSLYPIGNLFPEEKPYYIGNPNFEKLVSYGTPFFEEASAVIARKVKINEEFIKDINKKFKNWDFSSPYNFDKMQKLINEIYRSYQRENGIVTEKEDRQKYEKRVKDELLLSKQLIEKELGKSVYYLCWPHGDNDAFCHNLARQIGYKATTVGKSGALGTAPDRFERLGLGAYKNSNALTHLKTHYKIQAFRKMQPYYGFHKLYYRFRYGIRV